MVQKNTQSFEKGAIIAKYILTASILVCALLPTFYSHHPNIGNVVEYELAYLILGYVFLLGYDMRHFNLDYELEQV
jgi:hypothetical protein